ncbi:MAG TPA: maleylpyruvate isomerase N-terminal domain-containing protein [Acidimicrobiales bacterium]|nr:maleylpyruvate isomerase N-terminal domain-containing protein [Acidimicrobiales bacterium]
MDATWVVPEAEVALDVGAVLEATSLAAAAAASLLRKAGDLDAPVPGLTWTIDGLGRHLAMACAGFAASAEDRFGGLDADGTAALLARIAEVETDGTPAGLAAAVEAAAAAFVSAAARPPGDWLPTPWYRPDKENHLATMACLVLGELTVHGEDLAGAVDQPWSTDAEVARLVVTGVFPAKLPVIADAEAAAGVRATYELVVDGGPSFSLRLDGEGVTIGPAGATAVDCHVGADPVTMLLYAYGRRPAEELFAAGLLRSWGPDPSLGPRLKGYLRNP